MQVLVYFRSGRELTEGSKPEFSTRFRLAFDAGFKKIVNKYVTGVLSATIFTIVIFNFIARTNVLFRYFFKRSKSDFYMSHIYFIIVTIANGCFTYILCSLITGSQVTGLIMRGMLCFIVPNIFYIVLYVRYKEFRPVLNWIKQL